MTPTPDIRWRRDWPIILSLFRATWREMGGGACCVGSYRLFRRWSLRAFIRGMAVGNPYWGKYL